jgi:hypothetical protein
VYLTIAGVDDIPIDRSSDLYANLLASLRDLGDVDVPLRVDARERQALVLSTRIQLAPRYAWEPVSSAVRERLLDVFGFHRRALGQPALLCEVISATQNVPGVAYVDVDAFGGVPEMITDSIVAKDGSRVRTRRLLTQDDVAAAIAQIVTPITRNGVSQRPGDVEVWPGGMDEGGLRPAELAVFMPDVPDTLILNQIS